MSHEFLSRARRQSIALPGSVEESVEAALRDLKRQETNDSERRASGSSRALHSQRAAPFQATFVESDAKGSRTAVRDAFIAPRHAEAPHPSGRRAAPQGDARAEFVLTQVPRGGPRTLQGGSIPGLDALAAMRAQQARGMEPERFPAKWKPVAHPGGGAVEQTAARPDAFPLRTDVGRTPSAPTTAARVGTIRKDGAMRPMNSSPSLGPTGVRRTALSGVGPAANANNATSLLQPGRLAAFGQGMQQIQSRQTNQTAPTLSDRTAGRPRAPRPAPQAAHDARAAAAQERERRTQPGRSRAGGAAADSTARNRGLGAPYAVREGDRVWTIAARQLGGEPSGPEVARQVERIMQRNRGAIGDDASLRENQTLYLPETERQVQARLGAVTGWTRDHVRNRDYQWSDPNPHVGGRSGQFLGGRFAPKCNIFVGDALAAGGIRVRDRNNPRLYPQAAVWGNRNASISGFRVLEEGEAPRAGDIISNGDHMGIYEPGPDGERWTVSAAAPESGHNEVVHNDWGFRPPSHPHYQGPVVIRRYEGL